jgi:hypothetical protein
MREGRELPDERWVVAEQARTAGKGWQRESDEVVRWVESEETSGERERQEKEKKRKQKRTRSTQLVRHPLKVEDGRSKRLQFLLVRVRSRQQVGVFGESLFRRHPETK